MYNISEDNLFSCINFHSQNLDQQSPYQYYQQSSHQLLPPLPAQDPSFTEQAKVQKLEPTSHTHPDPLSRPTHVQTQQTLPHSPPPPFERQVQSIFCASKVHTDKSRCLKGEAYQTQNIGKHLKSITVCYLALLRQAKILEESEEMGLHSFQQSNGSFADFSELFKIQLLRQKCQHYFSSKDFVYAILTMTKMSFKSRLIMIKYSKKLRKLAFGVSRSWKLGGN